jgi:hypothetical protein
VLAAISLLGQHLAAGSSKTCLALVQRGCYVWLLAGKATRRRVTKAGAV